MSWVVSVGRSWQKETNRKGEGEERREKEEGRKEKEEGKRKKGREEKKRRGKGKEKRGKRKEERGRKKEAVTIFQQVGPQLPLGSMPSAQGGSTCFKGVAPCGEGEHWLQPCVRWPKRRAA